MQYIIDFTLAQLQTHPKFQEKHTDRQAEIIYDMLLGFDKFSKIACYYLRDYKVINIDYERTPDGIGWASTPEYILVATLTE